MDNEIKLIGTHSGSFHCDDVAACMILKELFPSAQVLRTRESSLLETCDIVVDVGGVFDPTKHRFDHHQRGFEETFDSEHRTKLSSVGLVWKYYGRRYLREKAGVESERVFNKVYDDYFESIDGIDNGIAPYDIKEPPAYTEPRTLSRMIASFNDFDGEEKERFNAAMEFVKSDFKNFMRFVRYKWYPSYDVLIKAVRERPHDAIVVLHEECSWYEHLFSVEKELGIAGRLLYVVYEGGDGSWRIRCVLLSETGFVCRRPLPEGWRGLRDEALVEACGVKESTFVHASGFTGGNRTLDGCMEMVLRAVEERNR